MLGQQCWLLRQTSRHVGPTFVASRACCDGPSCQSVCLCVQGLDTRNKKHLKNVGPIRHCEPPHAACSNFTLPFARCRYCRTPPLSHATCASMSTTTSTTTTTTTRDRGSLWPHRMGPITRNTRESAIVSVVSVASCVQAVSFELSYSSLVDVTSHHINHPTALTAMHIAVGRLCTG